MHKLIEHVIDEINARQLAGLALAGTLAVAQPNVVKAQSPTQHQTQQSHYNQIVAEVIAGEGAGEGEEGMRAIACVIQNRGGNPVNVVTAPHQFSAYEDKALMKRNYAEVKPIADKLASEIGHLQDITNGANHYVTKKLYDAKRNHPNFWTNKMKVTKIIGKHVFLRGK